MSREASDSSGGGLQIQTLLLSAVSAVAAATIVPLFWEKGTVIATAMTPVIVALVTEALRRPVQKVSEVAPRVAVRRFESASTARGRRVVERVPADRDDAFDPLAGDDPFDGGELRPHPGRIPGEDPFGLREPVRRRSWWKVGIATGLLAFVLAAAVVTASELTIFGGSVSGHRGTTTLFGGGHSAKQDKKDSGQDSKGGSSGSTSRPDATATPQSTAQPQATATPTPTPTPQATATPAPTTAAPQSTATPAP